LALLRAGVMSGTGSTLSIGGLNDLFTLLADAAPPSASPEIASAAVPVMRCCSKMQAARHLDDADFADGHSISLRTVQRIRRLTNQPATSPSGETA
jgi:hypothetical protein